jgi:hypothetical protein
MKKKTYKKIVFGLLLLSLMLTTSTFAYWANYVEGTSDQASGTLQIGSADSVETRFDLSSQLSSGGYLVPKTQLLNSLEGSVDHIFLTYDLGWEEQLDVSQIQGNTVVGLVQVDYNVLIEQDGNLLDETAYNNIYDLILVNPIESNPSSLTLNGTSESFVFEVTMEEPANQEEYFLISQSKITIVFHFRILDNFIEISNTIESGPYLELIGEDTMIIEVGSDYTDLGAIAYDSQGNEIYNVWYSGYFNTWELGVYTISYGAYSSFDNEMVEPVSRTIIVVDTTAPEIFINGNETFIVEQDSYYSDWGAYAIDNSGETITVSVSGLDVLDTSVSGTYVVTYTAIDSSGNRSIAYRNVIVK